MHCAAEMAERVTKILALVTAYDEVSANNAAMEDAALQFDGLLQVGASMRPCMQAVSEDRIESLHEHLMEP